jgi:hypothetical protein
MDLNGLYAISYLQQTPIELGKPHILVLATETDFLLFKEQVPLKFKKEISAVQWERKTFLLISLSTPVSFRWTVPLRNFIKLSRIQSFCGQAAILKNRALLHQIFFL